MTTYETLTIDFDCCTPHSGETGDSTESAPSEHDPVSLAHFPSAPIEGDTLATVQLVATDWRAQEDWERFEEACRDCAHYIGHVDPNWVRGALTNEHGLTIEPRRYSAFWCRAASKNGFLDFSHWGINSDSKGKNAGKPCKSYKLRSNA